MTIFFIIYILLIRMMKSKELGQGYSMRGSDYRCVETVVRKLEG